jgi:hypothetical protein
MAKKNVELLKRLRMRFLRMRHPKHFNMAVIAVETDCGSQMCIGGHILDLCGYKTRPRTGKRNRYLDSVLGVDFLSPTGRKVSNPLQAARQEVGLTLRESTLFYDMDIHTPKQAAARIQQLIDGCA